MFRYKCTIFRENKMLDGKASCFWEAVIYKVLRSVATSLLTLIKYKSKLQTFSQILTVAANLVLYFLLLFTLILTYIIIIIIRRQLDLDRPFSASSISIFKGLPSRLRQFKIYLSTISGMLLFILVTCRSQFGLYLPSFSSTGFIFNSSKISSLLLWSKRYPSVLLNAFISIDVFCFLSFSPSVQICFLELVRYNTCTFENFWVKDVLKVLFIIYSIWASFDSYC
jgi:hypothetical protein